MTPWMELVLYILGVSGVTHAIVYAGPLAPLRQVFVRTFGVAGFALVYCPTCVGFWVGAAWTFASLFIRLPTPPGFALLWPFYAFIFAPMFARWSQPPEHPTMVFEVPPELLRTFARGVSARGSDEQETTEEADVRR